MNILIETVEQCKQSNEKKTKTIRHTDIKCYEDFLRLLTGSFVWRHTVHMGYDDSEPVTKSVVAAQCMHMSSNPAE